LTPARDHLGARRATAAPVVAEARQADHGQVKGGMSMVHFELLKVEGILIIRPEAPFEATDFQRLAQEIDPYIEANGKLHGVMIDAESFPGWKDFAALLAHLKFVRDHHKKVQKVAAVGDSSFVTIAPKIVSHFVQADVRHFSRAQKQDGLLWLREENQ
jgi:hypothetical protein